MLPQFARTNTIIQLESDIPLVFNHYRDIIFHKTWLQQYAERRALQQEILTLATTACDEDGERPHSEFPSS